MDRRPVLVVMAGLPGVGKSSIARSLCQEFGAYHLRVDAIEDGMKAFGILPEQIAGSGYVAMANLAHENLSLGFSSVVDCVNPIAETRRMFLEIGEAVPCEIITIEVVCSDIAVHRERVEARGPEPSWQEVLDREYEPWVEAGIRIDTVSGGVENWIVPICGVLCDYGHNVQ
ncbi:MAG: ATP-binding protein [Armatimonadetes bacterium]|nr:ATP-binding protein [Armatimonadota bacterium]